MAMVLSRKDHVHHETDESLSHGSLPLDPFRVAIVS